MNELIPLQLQTIDGNAVETVSARELYSLLGLDKSNWSRWSKQNIVDNPFAVENNDYVGFVIMTNGNETTDFALVLDFAKKLAMQVKTEKGELVRKYFIECEKRLKEQTVSQSVQPIGELEDKMRVWAFVIEQTTLAPVAKETLLITTAETLTGVSIGYRPQIEQTTYSAKELGDVLGISANRVGRIANAHGLKTKEYGLYYLNKSPHSDKQVEHFRYFEKSIDKFKAILENA